MGVDFVKAALAAGHAVVGTGRDPDAVAKAVGDLDDLQVVRLDVTSPADAEAAVRAAVDRFGRIDVLVNNAGTFEAGYFEELTPEQVDRQLATRLLGPTNATRAVLPTMRKQRPHRCHRPRRAEGRRSQGADQRLPPTVHVALSRLAPRAHRKPEVVRDARETPVRRQVRSHLEPVQRPARSSRPIHSSPAAAPASTAAISGCRTQRT